ncbi:hypothetical protein B7486_36360 [cyanobacterium TDX16]|nr:hypothetical protein B7486_36360 [cyanobacterium TDX16]
MLLKQRLARSPQPPLKRGATEDWYKHARCLLLSVLATGAIATEAIAHKVEISGDVGGTIHLEPNDNPQAGKATLAWIALTRKGGQTIPLQQCNCQLAVYAEPRQKNAAPLLQPSLKAVTAEKYQGIPGAEIIFPKPGTYQVELKGTPKAGANFKPFQLNFDVTVAARAR